MSTMKEKKLPQRRCIGCGETKLKRDLIRVVRDPGGVVSVDPTGKKSGRGAYLCKNPACLKRAHKTRQLARNLDCPIPDDLIETLSEAIAQHE